MLKTLTLTIAQTKMNRLMIKKKQVVTQTKMSRLMFKKKQVDRFGLKFAVEEFGGKRTESSKILSYKAYIITKEGKTVCKSPPYFSFF